MTIFSNYHIFSNCLRNPSIDFWKIWVPLVLHFSASLVLVMQFWTYWLRKSCLNWNPSRSSCTFFWVSIMHEANLSGLSPLLLKHCSILVPSLSWAVGSIFYKSFWDAWIIAYITSETLSAILRELKYYQSYCISFINS